MPTDMFGRYRKERAGSSQNRMHHTPVSSSLRVKQSAILKELGIAMQLLLKPIMECQTNLIY